MACTQILVHRWGPRTRFSSLFCRRTRPGSLVPSVSQATMLRLLLMTIVLIGDRSPYLWARLLLVMMMMMITSVHHERTKMTVVMKT